MEEKKTETTEAAGKAEKKDLKYWLNEWESHFSAIIFIIIGIMLTVQVVSRYVFNHSFTSFEELATCLFVAMAYSGIAAAVTHRKHLTISALPDAVPFKVRKILLILANVIFGVFCIWLCLPMIEYIKLLKGFVLPVSRLPETLFYWPIPFFMALTVVRLIQDSIRLAKENEQTLGETVPPLDMNAYEKIAEARREAEAIAAAQEAEKKGAKK